MRVNQSVTLNIFGFVTPVFTYKTRRASVTRTNNLFWPCVGYDNGLFDYLIPFRNQDSLRVCLVPFATKTCPHTRFSLKTIPSETSCSTIITSVFENHNKKHEKQHLRQEKQHHNHWGTRKGQTFIGINSNTNNIRCCNPCTYNLIRQLLACNSSSLVGLDPSWFVINLWCLLLELLPEARRATRSTATCL